MSNSSISSIVFERYMRDSLDLRDLYNRCLTSIKEDSTHIRSAALSIQARWSVFENMSGLGTTISRAFGVETVAEDISTYISRTFKRVGVYLSSVLRSIINVRAAFPSATDDYDGALQARNALDPGLKSSGDMLLQFLTVVSDNFNDAAPRLDDRDALRWLNQLDQNFAQFAHYLHPSVRIDQSPAFQLTDVDDGDIPAVRITGNGVYTAAAPAGDWVATPTSRKSAMLAINNLAAPVAHQIAHAKPGSLVVMLKVVLGGLMPAGTPVTVAGAGVQLNLPDTRVVDSIIDSSGLHHHTISFRTTVAGGAITLSIGATGNITEWGTVDLLTVERYAAAPVSNGTGTVLDAVNRGPANYFAFAFRQPVVKQYLNLFSARDSVARLRAQGTLREVLIGVWKSAVIQAGFGSIAPVLNIFDQMTTSAPYTSAFWASDPVGINTVLINNGVPAGYYEEWVIEAYERMYLAFYEYFELIINAGSVDLLLPTRV